MTLAGIPVNAYLVEGEDGLVAVDGRRYEQGWQYDYVGPAPFESGSYTAEVTFDQTVPRVSMWLVMD